MQNAVVAETSTNPTGNSGERMALQSCLKMRQGAGLVTPHDLLLDVGCPSEGITLGKIALFDWSSSRGGIAMCHQLSTLPEAGRTHGRVISEAGAPQTGNNPFPCHIVISIYILPYKQRRQLSTSGSMSFFWPYFLECSDSLNFETS